MKTLSILCIPFILCAMASEAQTLTPMQDTYVTPGVGTNFATATALNAGGAGASQALVQFDLGALPPLNGAGIAKATLVLFVNRLVSAGTMNVSVCSTPWTIRRRQG